MGALAADFDHCGRIPYWKKPPKWGGPGS